MVLRHTLWFLLPPILLVLGQQTELKFAVPQAQTLWDQREILGNSTQFLHPISMGTNTSCDNVEIDRVFTDDFKFLVNYTAEALSNPNPIFNGAYNDPAVRFTPETGYRRLAPNRTTEKGVLTVAGCLMACVTEKEFFCREVDYFERDGGKCALYATEGLIYNQASIVEDTTDNSRYVGNLVAADHYVLYKPGETKEPCTLESSDFAFPYFGLGWKAMETGWYSLAKMMLNEATDRDPSYHMAYVGKMLSNDNMGYGLSDDEGVSYKERMKTILDADNFQVRLSLQEQLLVKALHEFQNSNSLKEGLEQMENVFVDDTSTFRDSTINVIAGNGLLLSGNIFSKLKQMADDESNVYALHLLLHNLNPYGAGKNRTGGRFEQPATDALFDYTKLNIRGAWPITFAGSDIAEYYSRWTRGRTLLTQFKDFVDQNFNVNDASQLLGVDGNNLVVHGLDVTYVSRSLEQVYVYERLHFFNIQLAFFKVADVFNVSTIATPGTEEYKELEAIRFRLIANAYFSTYSYIYPKYVAEKLPMEEQDWKSPIGSSEDDLTLASRAYYWAAAASNKILNPGARLDVDVNEIKIALAKAKDTATSSQYKTLIEIYETVVKGTDERINGQYVAAYSSASNAGALQDQLEDADFIIDGVAASYSFRLLVPLGYQFKADTYWALLNNEEASSQLQESLNKDTVIEAYRVAVDTAPLNCSRMLMGFGTSLLDRDANLPRYEDSPDPEFVLAFKALQNAWANKLLLDDDAEWAPLAHAAKAEEEWYDKPISGCVAEGFPIISQGDDRQLCWGGYIIIGVSAAILVIIAIIVGILCLRKKAAQTATKKKKNDKGFMFAGPVGLSRQDSYASSYQMGMGSLARNGDTAPYASQTLSIQRPFMDDADYTRRSNTLGANGRHGDDEFEVSTSH